MARHVRQIWRTRIARVDKLYLSEVYALDHLPTTRHSKSMRTPPPRVNTNRVNVVVNLSEGDGTSTIQERPLKANILKDNMKPIFQAMI
ncbi:hypothetical protein J1N35_038356 [Gossypium stocksii]|uniref:Uncharacterized protein n=1 Tax=Gossypium stocksii TaxID=47602 RepID=A0A9D3ULV5_9ROSI|nr:hypothetical protein J1N35_038356 [Gossypium stocksii]